jgi:hypothetical protein
VLSRLQSFDNLQASEFAATLVVPTADNPLRMSERLWRLRPSTARFVTSPRIGYASRPNRAIDGIGLSPTRFAALPAATGNLHPLARRVAILEFLGDKDRHATVVGDFELTELAVDAGVLFVFLTSCFLAASAFSFSINTRFRSIFLFLNWLLRMPFNHFSFRRSKCFGRGFSCSTFGLP